MYHILITGYYDSDNIGDEPVLRTVVNSIRTQLPDCALTVLSRDPAGTRGKYGVEALDCMASAEVERAVKRCDMLISGGGSLLQGVIGGSNLQDDLAVIRLARHYKKKVLVCLPDFDSIDRAENCRDAAMVLRRVDGIVVCD